MNTSCAFSSLSNNSSMIGKTHHRHHPPPSSNPVTSDEPPNEELQLEDAIQLMAKDLNKLSINEREKILYEVHGIAGKHEDSPEFRRQCLDEMQRALDEQLPNKKAYDLAIQTNSNYVMDPEFRLKFLRSDQYDPCKAALRLVRHLESKLELFGENLLCKDITQDDLDEGARECLYSGWTQELPVRDVAGRVVSIMLPKPTGMNCTVVEKMQRMFYVTMVLAEDVKTQVNGRVFIIWISKSEMDRSSTWKMGRLVRSLPLRFAAIHICFEGDKQKRNGPVIALLTFAFETFTRVRLRNHAGSPIELKYILQTFGIPVQNLPVTNTGEIGGAGNDAKWSCRREEERANKVQVQKQIADETPSALLLVNGPVRVRLGMPSDQDVLLGRGRLFQAHLGNIHFRYLVDEHQELYDQASKGAKASLASEIVEIVHQRDGRFLKEDGSGYVEVEGDVARKKVSTCFRTTRHRRKKDMQSELGSIFEA